MTVSDSTKAQDLGRVRGTLGLAVLFLMLGLAPSANAQLPSTDHDVVVVGAGAAGLYAAYTLKNLGFDVLVLEATDRHGGRVFSDLLGDVGVEHGAEELYGGSNNFVYNDIRSLYGNSAQVRIFRENANQDDLLVMDSDGLGSGTACWSVTGDCYLDPDVDDYWDFYSQTGDHDNAASDSFVSDFLADTWGVSSTSRGFHLYESGSPGGSYGTSVERLGLRSLSREWNSFSLTDAVYGLKTTGYEDALNSLYFNSVAPDVVYESPVTVVDTQGTKPVAIDANGVWHYADALIVTVSLGVLKAGMIDFVPDLPPSKQTAIQTIGMGKGMKISLRFNTQIWPSKFMSLLADGPAGNCWTPNKYQPAANDPVLTCFSMGINAEILGALPNDAARIDRVLMDLDAAFSGAASSAFVEGVVQDWTASPYVRGSYSYPAPGTRPLTGLTQRQILAQPVGGELFFAGEATHNTAASTVPGALQSGERAAGEVDVSLGGPRSLGSPTANFVPSVSTGNFPLEVSFSDLSSGSPTSWDWDFGDGSTGVGQNPTHEFIAAGAYTVSLTASNSSGSHTRVFPALVEVPEPGMFTGLLAGFAGLTGLERWRRTRRPNVNEEATRA